MVIWVLGQRLGSSDSHTPPMEEEIEASGEGSCSRWLGGAEQLAKTLGWKLATLLWPGPRLGAAGLPPAPGALRAIVSPY